MIAHSIVGRFAPVLIVGAILQSIGCSPGISTASGKIALDGRAILRGSVTLVDGTGVYHQGPIGSDGNWKVEGVPPGMVRIAVHSPKPRDRPRDIDPDSETEPPIERPGPSAASKLETWIEIPARFNAIATSGLELRFVPGRPLNIDLK